MIRRLIAPFVVAVVTFHAGQIWAQGAFPAPLPGTVGTANDPAFPPVNGAAPPPGAFGSAPPSGAFGNAPAQASFPGQAPMASSPFAAPPTQGGGPNDDCMKNFLPLRQEAEKRGHLLKVAGERKATAEEACKLINNFIQAEVKMIKYVEVNSARCGIPPQIHDQLKKGHEGSEGMRSRICGAAAQMKNAPQGPAGPSLSEVLGSAAQTELSRAGVRQGSLG